MPPATLDGEVYNDPNGSGTLVSGAGLSGWTVNLMSGSTTVATDDDRLERRLYFHERLPRLVHDRRRRAVGLRPDRAGIGQLFP